MSQLLDQVFDLSMQQKLRYKLLGSRIDAKLVIEITGGLDTDALEASLNALAERHEILRTTFEAVPGLKYPRQAIHADARFTYELSSRADEQHTLTLVFPAGTADNRSLHILAQELIGSYRAAVNGGDAELEEAFQYVDFAGWQQETFEEGGDEDAAEYWRKQDLAAAGATELPFEKAVSEAGSAERAQVRIALEPGREWTEAALFSAWQVLLQRLSGNDELGLRYFADGRQVEELRDAVGLYEIATPAFLPVDDKSQFAAHVLRVEELLQNHREWQDEALHIEATRDTADLGAYDIGFRYAEETLLHTAGDVTFAVRELAAASFPVKLLLSANRAGHEVTLTFDYDTAVYERETVERLADQYQTLLNAIRADTKARIADLEVITAAERDLLLGRFKGNQTADAPVITITERFETQVLQTPDRTAVVYEQEELTFAELNRQANRLARFLQEQGVANDTPVAVLLDRAIDWYVAIFGIWKAGGAYVPLNLDYPAERIAAILEDSQPPVVLTSSDLVGKVPQTGACVIALDSEQEQIAAHDDTNPALAASPDSLAYIIYTSGTTGKPKGVMIEQRTVLNLLTALRHGIYGNDAAQTGLQVAQNGPFVFDTSVKQIVQILDGHTLHLLSPEIRFETEKLFRYLQEREVNVLDCTPSQLALWIKDGYLDLPKRPQTVLIGGEPIHQEMWDQLAADDRTAFYNLYGPTECTVDATLCRIEAGTAPTIGTPIANVRVYVLDAQRRPVPLGAAGELHIGGKSLARGYLNDAAMTESRFVPHPFAPGERLYKTGDNVRFRQDGRIEYIGRTDHQIKVRGHRVELGEIEAQLLAHPAVQEAVVLGLDSGRDKRIAAYLVAKPGQAPTLTDLRGFLSGRLPDYMMPATFTVLDKMPLTVNGKIDRKALPSPDESKMASDKKYVAPTTPLEQALADIWKKLIGVEQVGIHDNFFALGGDSIMVIQFVSMAKRQGMHVSPGQLFEHQTIAGLSAVIGTSVRIEAEQGTVSGPVALTPVQSRFLERLQPESHHWNQSTILKVVKDLQPILWETAFRRLFEHHDALRLRFTEANGVWLQENADSVSGSIFEMFDLSGLSAKEQTDQIEAVGTRLQAGFDLANGPLLRAALFQMGAGEPARLLIVAHHLVIDGVSWRILLEDLELIVSQLEAGEAIELPAKTTSFQEWSRLLGHYASSDSLLAESAYWEGVLAEEIPPLPTDLAAADNKMESVRHLSVTLGQTQTKELLQGLTSRSLQINELLLASMALSVANWSNRSQMLIDLEGHGREEHVVGQADLSRTVGWFTTVYPVRLQAEPGAEPAAVLKSVKDRLRSIPNKGFGYGVLRYLTDRGAAFQARHRADISFNYLGQFDQTFQADGLFQPAQEAHGPVHSPRADRPYLLDVNAMVIEGQLKAIFSYSEGCYREESIQRLADGFIGQLQNMLAAVQSSHAVLASDFPLATLTDRELERLLDQYPMLESVCDLSPLQQHMLGQIARRKRFGQYVYQFGFSLQTAVDQDRFQTAWERVMQRHPALRSSLAEGIAAGPLAVVHSRVAPPISWQDWTDLPADEQQERMRLHLISVQRDGIDLTRPAAFELTMARTGGDTWLFGASFHLLFADVTSFIHIAIAEVFAEYDALTGGTQADVKAAPTYDHYLRWLREQDGDAAKSFWQDYLQGVTEPASLPFLHAVPLEEHTAYIDRKLSLSADTTRALQKAAAEHQLTLHSLFQGVWSLLLSRYTGAQDVLFGTIFSGRPASLEDQDRIVGRFVNVLPIRVQIPESGSFCAWIKSQQARHFGVLQNQHVPVGQIAEWIGREAEQPLFDTSLVFENIEQDASLLANFHQGKMSNPTFVPDPEIPLKAVVIPDEQLVLMISYLDKYFDQEVIEAVLHDFKQFAEHLAAAGDSDLSQFPALSKHS